MERLKKTDEAKAIARNAAKAAQYPEHVGQMGCMVVDCYNHAHGNSEFCAKHLKPKSRLNGVRVTVVHLGRATVGRDYDVIVVRSTAKAGKILELARKEKEGRKLISVEVRPEIECFDISDNRFRMLRKPFRTLTRGHNQRKRIRR